MLEAAWEVHATNLANAATTDAFVDALETFIKTAKIDLSKPARVVYARDTRPSGPALIAALEDGFKAIGAEARDAGVTTTPVLHYLVKAINTKGTKEEYGVDSEEGYLQKLSTAFKKLVVCGRAWLRVAVINDVIRLASLPSCLWSSTAPTAWAQLLARSWASTSAIH